ncbi:hypothetical protein BSCH_00277c [Candidatus Paraburkholderia schumanniana]|nr:hypothetical protein BSCH_00277c [Candidatus Paraburkholderia schumannianae]
MQVRTLAQAIAFGEVAAQYQQLRREHPTIRALTIKRYIRDNEGLTDSRQSSSNARPSAATNGVTAGRPTAATTAISARAGAIAATAELMATLDSPRWSWRLLTPSEIFHPV